MNNLNARSRVTGDCRVEWRSGMQRSALIIESQSNLASFVAEALAGQRFQCSSCENPDQAIDRIFNEHYTLLYLDLELLGFRSYSVCFKFRQRYPERILIAAVSSIEEGVQALDSGADDYLVKPIVKADFLARVRTRLRNISLAAGGQQDSGETAALGGAPGAMSGQTSGSGAAAAQPVRETLVCGDLVFDHRRRKLIKRGRVLNLTAREYRLLYLLATNAGRVFDRDELLREIWGVTTAAYDANLTVACSRIRKKIEENPAKPQYLLTLRGSGYLFAEHGGGGGEDVTELRNSIVVTSSRRTNEAERFFP